VHAYEVAERGFRERYGGLVHRPADTRRRLNPLEVEHHRWTSCVAKGVRGERHATVGARARGRMRVASAPVRVPYVVLEIDDADFRYSLQWAKRVTEFLWTELDVEPGYVSVAFSGRRSAHVRIPCGLFGNPLYHDRQQAKRVLREWAAWLCEAAGV